MLWLLIFTSLVIVFVVHYYIQVRRLPTGPTPVPLLGNGWQLYKGVSSGRTTIEIMKDWKEKFGNVYTAYFGTIAIVNICDYDTSYEAMVKKGHLFVDKWVPYMLTLVREGRGIIASNGTVWQEQRRFSLHALRNLGLGKNFIEGRIMMELDYRCEELEKEIGESGGKLEKDIQHFIFSTVGNIVNRMLFTERFTEDKEVQFFELLDNFDKALNKTSIFDMLINEWTVVIPVIKRRCDFIMKPIVDINNFIEQQVDNRIKDIEDGRHVINDPPEDFVDAFLLEMDKNKQNGTGNSFDKKSLVITLSDLWSAGQETTSSTLYWAFLYLARHPEYMDKLVKELDDVTGRQRPILLNDRPKTPYLNAVITETLRVSCLLPNNMFRVTSEDTTVGGKFIEKGTNVTAQIAQIMQNDQVFEDPTSFNPERFLKDNSNLEHVVAFGLGKRACPGESLARSELYLIISNFLLKFDVRKSEESELSMKAQVETGNMRKAKNYRLIVTCRDS